MDRMSLLKEASSFLRNSRVPGFRQDCSSSLTKRAARSRRVRTATSKPVSNRAVLRTSSSRAGAISAKFKQKSLAVPPSHWPACLGTRLPGGPALSSNRPLRALPEVLRCRLSGARLK